MGKNGPRTRAKLHDGATNQPKLPIYLDYQATTPVDPRVLALMLPYFSEEFGNPGSATHAFGRAAEEACERARGQIAALIGAEAREIVFTSGATEANNLAIKGLARFAGDDRRHIVTLATEHKCVLESCQALAAEGFRLTILPVAANGLVDLARLPERRQVARGKRGGGRRARGERRRKVREPLRQALLRTSHV